MIRDFSKEELAPETNDTEFTLGGSALLALGGGLLLLCAICFGLGYAVGHRGTPDPTAAQAPSASVPDGPAMHAGSGSKPGAAGTAPLHPQTPTTVDLPDGARGSAPFAQPVSTAAGTSSSSEPQVKSALDSEVRPALTSQPGAGQPRAALQVQPALTQAQGWMVQIAAVSHPEDAEVLVNALRRRGYAVTARRDINDTLIHVQTGPFVNRNEANAMRQRLLNDGYNAIVQ